MPTIHKHFVFRRLMGRAIAIVLIAVPFSCFAENNRPSTADFFIGHSAADFQLTDLAGQSLRLSSMKGNVVVLDFWATWCGPCRMEIPMIEALSKRLAKKNVMVIGVNSGEEEDVVRRFVAKFKMTYPVVLTTGHAEIVQAYGANALPTVAVVDRNGIIASYRVGVGPQTEELLDHDIHNVLSSKYHAPQPKPLEAWQRPGTTRNPTMPPASFGPDPNWKPETAEQFVARGYAELAIRNTSQAKADAEAAVRLSPNWYAATLLRGRVEYEDRRYAEAIQDFDKVVQQKPDCPVAYHFRGLSYFYLGQHAQAVPDYEKVIAMRPYQAAAYNDLGWAFRELKQFDASKANLDRAIELEPDYPWARENRAILFEKQSKWTGEVADLTVILGINPNNRWAQDAMKAARQQRPLGSDDQNSPVDVLPRLTHRVDPKYTDEARRAGVSAIIICNALITADGTAQDIRIERGAGFGLDENAIHAIGDWKFEPAKRNGVAVQQRADLAVSFRLLTENHGDQKTSLEFDLPHDATRPELIQGKIPENPKDLADYSMQLAFAVDADGIPQDVSVVSATPAGSADSVVDQLKTWRFRPAVLNGEPVRVPGTLTLFTKSWPARDSAWEAKTADEFLSRGWLRVRQRKFPQAEADAEEVLKVHPDSASARYLHGRAAYDEKEYAAAIEDLDKVITQKPDWPEVYRYRGLAHWYAGQRDLAVSDYKKAIELDPNLAVAHDNLGRAYAEIGQFELANECFDRAIELEPNLIAAWENRAKLLAKQGNLTAEEKELVAILGLSPRNGWAKDELEAVRQKVKSPAGKQLALE